MKKLISLFFLVIIMQHGFAQSVGIGTGLPNSSTILDISSSNKGVLFPRIFLAGSADNAAIASPAAGLIIYNTNSSMSGGAGLYYNSNTPASPNWAKVGDIKLPYNNATSDLSSAFYIQNYGAGSLANGIRGYSENGTGLYGTSNNGVGVYAGSFNGNALEVNGKLKISGTGQSPAQGKVLTTDANGNATWEGAIAFCSRGIQPDGAADFSEDVEKKVPFYITDYNYGNGYTNSTQAPYSTFTAPVKGIYHFDVKAIWTDAGSSGWYASMRLKTTYNGVTKEITQDRLIFTGEFFDKHNINIDIQLEAGTQVFVTLVQDAQSVMSLVKWNPSYSHSYFSGRLVMRL